MTKPNLPALVLTALFSLAMLGGGLADLLHADPILQSFTHLGLPIALASLLGTWKLLGVIALWAPGFDRVREWAYAGFFFDLSGALFFHLNAGDSPEAWAAPLILLVIGAASYILRGRTTDTDTQRHLRAA